MSVGCLNEHVYLYLNHPEFPTVAKSKHVSRFFFIFHFAKENSFGPLTLGNLLQKYFSNLPKRK